MPITRAGMVELRIEKKVDLLMDKPMEIPKFDLAEQIMAEQRKLSAVRRKGPGKRAKAPGSKSAKSATGPQEPQRLPTKQEQIIAEIVTRDIDNLLKGNALDY